MDCQVRMKSGCHGVKASRLRGEEGVRGDAAKLQEVAGTIFGDGLAVEEKEKGESRTAAREGRCQAQRARRWQERRSCAWNEAALSTRLRALAQPPTPAAR